MHYRIALNIHYDYPSLSAGGRQLLRLLPAHIDGRQHRLTGIVDIKPTCEDRVDRTDFFGNAVSDVAFHSHHDHVHFQMKATVACFTPPHPTTSLDLDALRQQIAQVTSLESHSPLHFLTASPYVRMPADICAFAAEGVTQGQDCIDIIEQIGQKIHAHMTFDAEATSVETPMEDAFKHQHGVCQDFSHIMIACLRSLHIPAGYVSGFIRTLPPEGEKRLEGADAMHAWVRAWCGPVVGWVEYDPTNALFASSDHIVVSYGRDYDDVAPTKGVLKVIGDQHTRHTVDVEPIDHGN